MALGLVINPASVNMSIWKDTELRGGIVYERYTRCAMFAHVVGFVPRWGNRDFLFKCFDYPYNQLGVDRLFGLVASNNLTALDFIEKLGFKEETIIRRVYPDADQVVLVLEKANCRFLSLGVKFQNVYAS